MRQKTELFLIDGQPMLVPDEDMAVSLEDIDASDAGRDESGFMHRIVVRRDVGKWNFSYAHLTEEEYAYMERLFAGKSSFQFTHPSHADRTKSVVTTAYRSKHAMSWHSVAAGQFRNYQFAVTEC